MTSKEHKRVLVLMSGGVDSSTVAALLKKSGHDVAGVYLKLWDSADSNALSSTDYVLRPHLGDPCWATEMRDAARVAAHLGISFQVWDVTDEYKQRVLQNFYAEYAAGRTPNPDVLCNSEIKFGVALKLARKMDYEYVATGHYVRLELRPTSYVLRTAADSNKDQSYFLWRLTQEQLSHVLFPIGEYIKSQVRALARELGLHNWNKKDSQGVCFLGKIELKEFLYHNKSLALTRMSKLSFDRSAGPIVDVHGKLLGFHDGLAHFTIGQRHGTKLGGTLSVPNGHAKRGGTGPYYVVEKDMTRDTLVVAHESDEAEYRAVECKIKNVKCKVESEFKCMARVRYRGELVPVTVVGDQVVFARPMRAVAPGQSIVFYDGERMVGGGVIDSVILQNSPVTIPLNIGHWTLIR